MKTVYKYILSRSGEMLLPKNSKVLTVGMQDTNFCIWVEIDKDETLQEHRTFAVYGTGWEMEDREHCYIGTAFEGNYVWHIYEVV